MDGMDTVDTLYANTRNNPIEDIESHLPLRVNRYELREDIGGGGRVAWRDRFRPRVHLSDRRRLLGRRRRAQVQTVGVSQVELRAARARSFKSPLAGQTTELPSKVPYRKARAGDRLVAYGPSGGGYGDPLARSPESVLDNVLDGLLPAERARENYGVVIAGQRVDADGTRKLPRPHARCLKRIALRFARELWLRDRRSHRPRSIGHPLGRPPPVSACYS